MNVCTTCGTVTGDSAVFCEKCGTRVTVPPAETPPDPEPTKVAEPAVVDVDGLKIPWYTRPWHRDWVLWLVAAFWAMFSWQQMYKVGRQSSISLFPAFIDLAFSLVTSFVVVFLLLGLPALIIRRLVRGATWKRKKTAGQPWPYSLPDAKRGWMVWLFVGIAAIAVLCWLSGRSQNIMVKIANGEPVSASSEGLTNEEIAALVQPPAGTAESAVAFAVGATADDAYSDLIDGINKYFSVKVDASDPEAQFPVLKGHLDSIASARAKLDGVLAGVTDQAQLPAGAPDLARLRAFTASLGPWIDARQSYYAAIDACDTLPTQKKRDLCFIDATDNWEKPMEDTIGPVDKAYKALNQ